MLPGRLSFVMRTMHWNAKAFSRSINLYLRIRCQDVAQAGHMVGVPVRQDDEIEIGEINALCFHVGGKRLTVIASVEQNSLASDLNERGEAPILLHRCVRAEGVVQDRDLGL